MQKLDSFSALSLIMTLVFSILSFLLSILLGPSVDSSLRAGKNFFFFSEIYAIKTDLDRALQE